MARYIDADAIDYKNYNMHINGKFNRELLKDVETLEEAFYKGLVYMHNRIEETPTADVVERKKGEWINTNAPNDYSVLKCSVCGEVDNRMYYSDNFCPNCGADMRGRKNG